jgi:hypothetical protein
MPYSTCGTDFALNFSLKQQAYNEWEVAAFRDVLFVTRLCRQDYRLVRTLLEAFSFWLPVCLVIVFYNIPVWNCFIHIRDPCFLVQMLHSVCHKAHLVGMRKDHASFSIPYECRSSLSKRFRLGRLAVTNGSRWHYQMRWSPLFYFPARKFANVRFSSENLMKST